MAKLKLPKRDVTTLVSKNSKNIFKSKIFSKTLKDSASMKIPQMLFSELIFESDLTIMFASAGVGKTMLAMQIADSISRGTNIHGFINQSEQQKVLYFDFELSDKQLEGRYCEKLDGTWFNQYDFHENLIRVTFETDYSKPITAESVFDGILQESKYHEAKIIFIDNITWIAHQGLETSKDAGMLMKKLDNLKKEHKLTIIVLAHTPKKYKWTPMELIDLAGSMQIGNFCDSVFAINFSKIDDSYRYIKQVKCRFTENKFHSNNVITARITKIESNFTGYEIMDADDENILEENHLASKVVTAVYDEEQIIDNKEKAIEIIKEKPDISSRQLALEIDVSRETARKYLKNYR